MPRNILKTLFNNSTIKVFRGNLKGVSFLINDLFPGSLLFKDFEPEKQFCFKELIRENETVFDIGANIGIHTLFIAGSIPGVNVFAFEPLKENVQYLHKVISLNNCRNVTVLDCAAGNENGMYYFEEGPNNFQGKLSAVPTAVKIRMITLDHLVSSENITPAFIKIDVEGAERMVLEGAVQTLKKFQPLMVIELHNPSQDIQVAQFLSAHRYEFFRLSTDIKRIRRTNKFLKEIKNKNTGWPDHDGVWGNIVAIPESRVTGYKHLIDD